MDKKSKKIDLGKAKAEELDLEARRVRLRSGVRSGTKSAGGIGRAIGRAVSA